MIKKFFSKLLLGKYLGGGVRHGLTWLGGYLVGVGLATPEAAEEAARSLTELLTSPEMIAGLATLLGLGSSVAEKKTRKE